MNGLIKTSLLASCVLGLIGICAPAQAQNPADKTILSVEILLPKNSNDIAKAQRWGRVFDKLGHGVRINKPVFGDKPEIKENARGSLRIVKAIGEMDRSGTLKFPGAEFSFDETDKLKKWLDELKTYGAQGSPEGKELWGLNSQQFEDLVKALSNPLEFETKGKTASEIIRSLPIPEEFPVVFDESIGEDTTDKLAGNLEFELSGVAAGTALAGVLSQSGLGFLPKRTPQGTVQLTVMEFEKLSRPWPVGWKVDEGTPRNLIAPALFKFVQTGFDGTPLKEVLDAISNQTGTPILIDSRSCAEREIDPSKTLVSYAQKKTAWAVVMTSVVRQAKLTYSLRRDEGGRPLVWVTPFVPYRLDEE